MSLQFYAIFLIYSLSQNLISTQDFFKAQLSPSTLTSVPYLDGEVAIYEHIQNRSRLYVPPLAVLYLNQSRVFYRRLDKTYLLRLSLILYTNELRTTILKYVSNTRNRCNPIQEICDIKMVPTERLRIVWKRKKELSSDYKLDTSWQSNTALLNKIDVHIECTTNETCYELLNDVLETPDTFNGFELEYSTQTEKQTRKIVTITGQHIMKTQMYSELKQLPSSTLENTVRYLLVDDMNQLLTEILTTMELEEITDSDHISHDDQKTLTELLRQRLSLNAETLHGHTERQWNSVYWNSDNIRPDKIVNLLNDELKQLQNKTSLTNQNQSFTQQQQNQQRIDQERSHQDYDNSENVINNSRNKTDRLNDQAASNSTGQKIIDQNSSDRSQGHTFGRSQSDSHHNERSSSHGGSAGAKFLGIGASASYSQSKANIDAGSKSRSHYGSNDWRNAFSKNSDRSYDNSHAWKDTQVTGDDLSLSNKNAWRRAANQDRQAARDRSESGEDVDSFQELRQKNFDFYTNNRQFIEFTGEKFIVKPVKAYKLNLATFEENTKFVHKSIIVSHIDLIHAVPIRIISSSSDALLTTVPVTDNYTNVFESKLHELNTTIENNVDKLKLYITNQLTELKSSMTELKPSITALDNKFTELQSSVTALDNKFTEHKSSIKSFDNKFTEVESSVTALNNKFTVMLTKSTEDFKSLLNTTDLTSSHPEIGTIVLFTGFGPLPATSKWLHCNGSEVSRYIYSKLFSIIGTKYGLGDGQSTFHLPDFRNRFPQGINQPSQLGSFGGEQYHTLTVDELPSHQHAMGSIKAEDAGRHNHELTSSKIYRDLRWYTEETKDKLSWVVNTDDPTKFEYPHLSSVPFSIDFDGGHTHQITAEPTETAGNDEQFEILPPYLLVDFIIYTG